MGAYANSKRKVNRALVTNAALEILPLESHAAESSKSQTVIWQYASFTFSTVNRFGFIFYYLTEIYYVLYS